MRITVPPKEISPLMQVSISAAEAYMSGTGTVGTLGGYSITGTAAKFVIPLPTHRLGDPCEIASIEVGYETSWANDYISNTTAVLFAIDQTSSDTIVDDATDQGNGTTGKDKYSVTPADHTLDQRYLLLSFSLTIGTSDVKFVSFRVTLKRKD